MRRSPFLRPPLRNISILASGCLSPWLIFLLQEFLKTSSVNKSPLSSLWDCPDSLHCSPPSFIYILISCAIFPSLPASLFAIWFLQYSPSFHGCLSPCRPPPYQAPSSLTAPCSCWKPSLWEAAPTRHTYILLPRVGHKSRTSYVVCRAQCKMKLRGTLVKKWSSDQVQGPSEHPAVCDCMSRWSLKLALFATFVALIYGLFTVLWTLPILLLSSLHATLTCLILSNVVNMFIVTEKDMLFQLLFLFTIFLFLLVWKNGMRLHSRPHRLVSWCFGVSTLRAPECRAMRLKRHEEVSPLEKTWGQ